MSEESLVYVRMSADRSLKCEIWRVGGIPNQWYANKAAAERAARNAFPSDDPHTRYARVSYVTFSTGH